MIPQIINIGPFPINSFGLTIALAIIICILCLQRSFAVNSIDPKLAEKYVFTGGIVGLVGARIWYVFVEDFAALRANLFDALLSSAGFTFYGGFIIAAITLLVMSRIDRLPLSKFVDSFGPTLALGYAVGRLGCQLSGDGDYGIATDSIWGMSFAQGVIPTPPGVLVFPTPLYESLLSGFMMLWLISLETKARWQVPYSRFGAYLVLLGAERFVVEIIRVNPDVAGSFSQAQIVAIILIAIGLPLLLRRYFLIGSK